MWYGLEVEVWYELQVEVCGMDYRLKCVVWFIG